MPLMTRFTRRLAATIAAVALAFAQLAVSAYACPQQDRMAAPAAKATPAPAEADHCAKSGNGNLCERHCAYGSTSVQSTPPAAAVPDLTPLPWRIELISAPAVEQHACKSFIVLPRAEPPPLARFGVLRI
jgi:hypothetical protein